MKLKKPLSLCMLHIMYLKHSSIKTLNQWHFFQLYITINCRLQTPTHPKKIHGSISILKWNVSKTLCLKIKWNVKSSYILLCFTCTCRIKIIIVAPNMRINRSILVHKYQLLEVVNLKVTFAKGNEDFDNWRHHFYFNLVSLNA
jgi:hypothetical protein